MKNIPIVPGRGLISNTAIELRERFLHTNGISIEQMRNHHFDTADIQNNIESFIGSVEIPVGIVGPLLFVEGGQEELVYTAAGTLEGALVASMNRGARAISRSGGFEAIVIHQKMIRAPLFIFKKMEEAIHFVRWIEQHFLDIQAITKLYSNHAELQTIEPFLIGRNVHLKFIYTTGDASGQNMTTTCTWHAMLWIEKHFAKDTNIEVDHCIIEGNAAADKKVAISSVLTGRGVHVVAEAFLSEEVIHRVLRTSSTDIFRYFTSSQSMSTINGMSGYNINIANAVAAIFVATGQDLGSIHESATGILTIEKTADGLYLSLNLPSLVIGTVGGATHLPRQREALDIMGCQGTGKLERFAKLIAGFALSLEISTYAAIVSGEFAKAHEKLGRNKPVYRMLKSDINTQFIKNILGGKFMNHDILSAKINKSTLVDNGIITNLTGRVSKRIIGFVPIEIEFSKEGTPEKEEIVLKSKAPDTEVIKGLHAMAASISPKLSDLIYAYARNLEYTGTHLKEIALYDALHRQHLGCIPQYYGAHIDSKKEIYLMAIELLTKDKWRHINTENTPEQWTPTEIKDCIREITTVHQFFEDEAHRSGLESVTEFHAFASVPLYKKMLTLVIRETTDEKRMAQLTSILEATDQLEADYQNLQTPRTVIHNDFNPRNIAIRKNGTPCIYDWELAVINIPHRDIVEFLSFVLPINFSKETLMTYINYHLSLYEGSTDMFFFKAAYSYAIREYIITRVAFYEVAGILMKYDFSDRVLDNSFQMLEMMKLEFL